MTTVIGGFTRIILEKDVIFCLYSSNGSNAKYLT